MFKHLDRIVSLIWYAVAMYHFWDGAVAYGIGYVGLGYLASLEANIRDMARS